MTEQDVSERVRALLSRKFKVPSATLVPACSLYKDLNADSADMVEIMEGVEEEFKLAMLPEEESRIRTVGDLTQFVLKQMRTE